MRYVLHWHRDILVLACGADEKTVFHVKHMDLLRKRASGMSVDKCLRNVRTVDAASRRLEWIGNEGPVLSSMFADLA
jgi:hypothetical protein